MKEIDILVVGGGPAGLSASITAREFGASVILVDENDKMGGQLVKQTHKIFGSKEHICGVRGLDIGSILETRIHTNKNTNIHEKYTILSSTSCIGIYPKESQTTHLRGCPEVKSQKFFECLTVRGEELITIKSKAVIVATGASENMLLFKGNDLPGVYGAGAVQTLMNVYGVIPGKNVLMVGSGNIGLIVSYQLMQAGINVVGIVEALLGIGGYLVHAARIRRLEIPIYTSHTIKEAIGKEEVRGAIIAEIDTNWKEINGTEKRIECDTICLAAGLSPSCELLNQIGCKMAYIPELGGWIAQHSQNLETSVKGVYVAGDVSGIEEAVTAMLEGKIAGASAVFGIYGYKEAKNLINKTLLDIEEFRKGPFGEKARIGKEKLLKI